MDGNTFCTMGGMSHDLHMTMHHRKLMEAQQHDHHHHDHWTQHNDISWDAGPIINPPEGHQEHDMHGMDNHNHQDMNHDTSGMDHDRSSHSNNGMSNMQMGTVMYMDGFHSALFPSPDQPPPPCLNLFHPNWSLNTPAKFVSAMICVAFIGVLVEACGVWRVSCLRRGRKWRREMRLNQPQAWEEQRQNVQPDVQGQQLDFRRQSQRMHHGVSDTSEDITSEGNNNPSDSPNTNIASTSTTHQMFPPIIRRAWRTLVPTFIRTRCTKVLCCSSIQQTINTDVKNMKAIVRRYDMAAAVLHASRAWLGYLLMLSVMSYAIEFLISGVLGMVLGRYWFAEGGGSGGGGVMDGAVGVGGGIGGMGMGDAGGDNGRHQSGQIGLGMTDLQQHNGNDGTWGGGDPCCGIDDDDEDDDNNDEGGGLREPLISSLVESANAGVTRRNATGGPQAVPYFP